jgi:hypothetical protein
VANPFSTDTKKPVAVWQPTDPTKNLQTLDVWPADSGMVQSLQNAVDDWAQFYTNGQITTVQNSFDLAGPQYAQLLKEQPSVKAKPDPQAAVVELGTVGKVSQTDNTYVVRVKITWTTPGEDPTIYNWDITMEQQGTSDKFILNSTKDTAANVKKPLEFCSAATLISKLDDDSQVVKKLKTVPANDQFDVYEKVLTIREKTWNIFGSVVAGTDDEVTVNPIVEEYQTELEAAKKDKSIQAVNDSIASIDNSENRSAIQGRVNSQCSLDIENR